MLSGYLWVQHRQGGDPGMDKDIYTQTHVHTDLFTQQQLSLKHFPSLRELWKVTEVGQLTFDLLVCMGSISMAMVFSVEQVACMCEVLLQSGRMERFTDFLRTLPPPLPLAWGVWRASWRRGLPWPSIWGASRTSMPFWRASIYPIAATPCCSSSGWGHTTWRPSAREGAPLGLWGSTAYAVSFPYQEPSGMERRPATASRYSELNLLGLFEQILILYFIIILPQHFCFL